MHFFNSFFALLRFYEFKPCSFSDTFQCNRVLVGFRSSHSSALCLLQQCLLRLCLLDTLSGPSDVVKALLMLPHKLPHSRSSTLELLHKQIFEDFFSAPETF